MFIVESLDKYHFLVIYSLLLKIYLVKKGKISAAIGRLACDMEDIKMGIQLIANTVKGSKIDAEQVIGQIYLNRGNGDISNRQNIQRAFIDVTWKLFFFFSNF